MRTHRSLFSLTPQQLLSETRALLAARAQNTAELLAHLAEIDSRRLYVEAAYGSMQAFCVGELGMAEDSADKTIQAVRAVQRHPALLAAIADCRLHLSAVNLLAPHLTQQCADELVDAASGLSCARIRELLAERERARQPQSTDDLLAQVIAKPRCEPDSNRVMSSAGHAESPRVAVAAAPAAPAAM